MNHIFKIGDYVKVNKISFPKISTPLRPFRIDGHYKQIGKITWYFETNNNAMLEFEDDKLNGYSHQHLVLCDNVRHLTQRESAKFLVNKIKGIRKI